MKNKDMSFPTFGKSWPIIVIFYYFCSLGPDRFRLIIFQLNLQSQATKFFKLKIGV